MKSGILVVAVAVAASTLIVWNHISPLGGGSRIVREVEAAGAGEVSRWGEPQLMPWFARHREFARKITEECRPIAERAPATWIFTPEGTACHSASLAGMWIHEDWKAEPWSW